MSNIVYKVLTRGTFRKLMKRHEWLTFFLVWQDSSSRLSSGDREGAWTSRQSLLEVAGDRQMRGIKAGQLHVGTFYKLLSKKGSPKWCFDRCTSRHQLHLCLQHPDPYISPSWSLLPSARIKELGCNLWSSLDTHALAGFDVIIQLVWGLLKLILDKNVYPQIFLILLSIWCCGGLNNKFIRNHLK